MWFRTATSCTSCSTYRTMGYEAYDKYAAQYDAWFIKNGNVLETEATLVARTLKDAGTVLSIGCGSGLFEMLLKKHWGITVTDGIEPSVSMAEIARKRGMDITIGTAEDVGAHELDGKYDTLLFNGCPCYINDLGKAFANTSRFLRKGGRAIVIDIPKESSYALLYNLAKTLGTWDHPMLHGVCPPNPYPIEFVSMANWRTTAEKLEYLEKAGYSDFSFMQTLTRVPLHTDTSVEEPSEGCDRGSYVAITATLTR